MNLLKNDLFLKVSKFAIAFGLIGWMVWKGLIDFSTLQLIAKPQSIALVLALAFVNLAIANWRWGMLLQARQFPASFSQTMPLSLIAVFFNFAIPGAIGGDVVKGYYIAQNHPERKMEAVTSVIVDRVMGLYSMVTMALIAIGLNITLILNKPELVAVTLATLGIFVAMSFFMAAALSKRFRRLVRMDSWLQKLPGGQTGFRFYEAFHSYRSHIGTLFAALMLSLMAHSIAILFMMFVGFAIGETSLSFATFLFAVPLGFMVSAVPIAPAGIGVGQYAFLALFQMYSGTETNLGQIGITVFQVTLFLWGLVGGYLYLKKKKPVDLKEVEA